MVRIKTKMYGDNCRKQKRAMQMPLPCTILFWGTIFFLVSCWIGCKPRNEKNRLTYPEFRTKEFTRLEAIREKKIKKVLRWLNRQKELIENEETVSKLTDYHLTVKSTFVKALDKDKFLRINNEIELFFVYELGSFYDLLFIDEKGVVFYSVKMENDFQTSLINGPYAGTRLAKIITNTPDKISFVDFEYYGASDEPAAFYILPIRRNNRHNGWIALQISIDHLNKLLTERSGLGRTGEAYLVNNQQLMLTESRFINDSMILSKKIDTEAVRGQTELSGNKTIDDYRGIKVLSSFRSFSVGNASWRILVEKDEDEVVTDYYRTYSKALFPLLVKSIEVQTEEKLRNAECLISSTKSAKRVDVGELVKLENRNALFTPGIATCTGVVAYRQNDDLSYMAHLSPLDDCYNRPKSETALLGDKKTDLISLLIRRVQFFDIKPCQTNELRFIVGAPHSHSLQRIIGKLIDAGVTLSQIKAGILPRAGSVSLICNMENCSIVGQWYMRDSNKLKESNLKEMPSLDSFVKKM